MKTKLFYASTALAALFTACQDGPQCDGSRELGIIVSSVNIPSPCFKSSGDPSFIIDDDAAYRQLFTDPSTGQVPCTLPVIDFNTNTLLGLPASGQCEVEFIREVSRVENESLFRYRVTVNECRVCKVLRFSDNWVLVPKLPAGWSVSFETKRR